MYKICIFDMDGTILNTLYSIASFGNEALEHFGYEPIAPESYKRMVGDGADMLMQRMLEHGGNPVSDCKVLRKKYDSLYEKQPLRLVQPYAGIEKAMGELKKMGVKLGVLSNKPDNMTKVLAEKLFPGVFDLVQGQRPDFHLKPDAKSLLYMINRLDGRLEETLYCGDSEVDIQTGKNAGVFTVGVGWGFRETDKLLNCGADCVVDTAEELYRLILGRV